LLKIITKPQLDEHQPYPPQSANIISASSTTESDHQSKRKVTMEMLTEALLPLPLDAVFGLSNAVLRERE